MPQREGQHRKTRWGDASEERDVSRRAVLFPDMAGWFAVRMALRAPGSHTSSEIIVYGQTHLAVPVVCRAHQPRATGHPLLSFTSILLFCLLLVLASWGWILTLHTGGGPEANCWVGKAEARQAPQLLWGGRRLRGACSHLQHFPSLSLPALAYKGSLLISRLCSAPPWWRARRGGSWVRECPLSLPGACTEASSFRAAGSFAPSEVSGGGTALPLCISPKVAATLPGGYKAFRQAAVSQGLSLVVWHGLGPPDACGSAHEGCHGRRSSSCSSGGHLRVWGGSSHGATWSPWPGS